MRKSLKPLDGQRFKVRAKVNSFGFKTGFKGNSIKTILLTDIRDAKTNEILSDHLWFTCGKWSKDLKNNDLFEFEARVGKYRKGYKGFREDIFDKPVKTDYRLERPTKVTILKKEEELIKISS